MCCCMNALVSLTWHCCGVFWVFSYSCSTMIILAQHFRVPVQRNRPYSICINCRTATWTGNPLEFEELFYTTMELDGDVFFNADSKLILKEAQHWSQLRKFHSIDAAAVDSIHWPDFYTSIAATRLQDYLADASSRCAGTYIFDLTQNLEQGGSAQSRQYIPCLCTNSHTYSRHHQRHLTPEELLCCHGMPATHA